MTSGFGPRRGFRVVLATLGLSALVVAGWLGARPAGAARATDEAPAAHEHHGISDADMKQRIADWFASHPRLEPPSRAQGTPAATFTASGFQFDADANPGTVVDTVVIDVGESVLWTRQDGEHTVTNGQDSLDPNAGTVFNVDLGSASPTFEFTFTSPGTVPFFCAPHEGFNMKGVVVVQGTTGVTPIAGESAGIGFTRQPAPNPTTAWVSFRFALREAGRTRIQVFDARGRRVATVVDAALGAGSYAGRWDGRGEGGAVGTGVYYLRLSGPGIHQSERVTVIR